MQIIKSFELSIIFHRGVRHGPHDRLICRSHLMLNIEASRTKFHSWECAERSRIPIYDNVEAILS
jgi:hypothetical protein